MPPEPPASAVPRSLLRAAILVLLQEQPRHGYELLERIEGLGLTDLDRVRLYRALHALEREGHIRSSWQESPRGPAKRIYHLTKVGARELPRLATLLEDTRRGIDAALSRYDELAV